MSGFLLNVAMTPVDEAMVRLWRDAYASDGLFLYLRFVDDVVMLADSTERLEEGIQVFESEIKESVGPNVRLNLEKAEPRGVKAYLKGRKESEADGGDVQASDKPVDGVGLASYITLQDYLTRANLQLFTATVVREMSDLSEEALDERYGAAGVERLERLMELATMEIDDFEVGADARLSFAVNRIASASWPEGDVVCDGRMVSRREFVRRILLIAETALRRHPWRYKLWRPILRIAMRASIEGALRIDDSLAAKDGIDEGTDGKTGLEGLDWLFESILPLVSWPQGEEPRLSSRGWDYLDADTHVTVPESPCQKRVGLEKTVVHRLRERCSFQRTEFLRQLTRCLEVLQRIANSDEGIPALGLAAHFTQGEARAVLKQFSNLSRVLRKLYSGWNWRWEEQPFLWWWVVEALSVLIMKVETLPSQVIGSMGVPRALALRTQGGLGDRIVSDALRRHGLIKPDEQPLRVLGYYGVAKTPILSREVPSSAWFTMLRQNEDSWRIMEGLLPPLSQPEWAALARLSLWPFHHDFIANSEAPMYAAPPIGLILGWSSLWDRFISLMDYRVLRSLLLAHGMPVTMGQFPGWFPGIHMQTKSSLPMILNKNLQMAMYGLGIRSSGCIYPEPSAAPAIGLDWAVALQVWDRTRQKTKGQPRPWLVCPSTVVLSPKAHRQVIEIRDSCLVVGNERDFVKPQVTDDVVVGVDGLSPELPAPPPIFLLCEELCGGDRGILEEYRLAALMLWMVEGGESLITSILSAFPWQMPFTERYAVRARYAIPQRLWGQIELSLGVSSPWAAKDAQTPIVFDDDSWLTHVSMGSDGDWKVGNPKETESAVPYADEIHVRVVQPTESVVMGRWLANGNRPYLLETKETMGRVPAEVAARLHESWSNSRIAGFSNGFGATGETRANDSSGPPRDHIIMFPEWHCDQITARGFRQFCKETGIAVLCGMLPRELPRAVPVIGAVRRRGLRYVVNEAVLVMPGFETRDGTSEFCLPTAVHQFYVRKCVPNVAEVALMEHLQSVVPDTQWRFVGGDRWFRLSHPSWGSFCVTICSDVLTSGKWRDLVGKIQHLFIPARNKDVELYDQLTWVTGYRLFANAVTVNHGKFGGTAVWTPRHGYDREVFRARGQNKGVSAVVSIPVQSLIKAQAEQYGVSREEQRAQWRRIADGSADNRGDKFKTPSPQVRHKDPEQSRK